MSSKQHIVALQSNVCVAGTQEGTIFLTVFKPQFHCTQYVFFIEYTNFSKHTTVQILQSQDYMEFYENVLFGMTVYL